MELPKSRSLDVAAICELYAGEYPYWSVEAAKIEAARHFKISKQFANEFWNGPGIDSHSYWQVTDINRPGPPQPSDWVSPGMSSDWTVSKLRGGCACDGYVQDACAQLECRSVSVLGEKVLVKNTTPQNVDTIGMYSVLVLRSKKRVFWPQKDVWDPSRYLSRVK